MVSDSIVRVTPFPVRVKELLGQATHVDIVVAIVLGKLLQGGLEGAI